MKQCYRPCDCVNDREKAKRYAIVAGIYFLVFALSGAAMFSSLVENGYVEWSSDPFRTRASPGTPPAAPNATTNHRRPVELKVEVNEGDVAALNELTGKFSGWGENRHQIIQ
jgi:hypothetical protein